jgi:RNA polymerase sigma-70 factor (ECF subfamily)
MSDLTTELLHHAAALRALARVLVGEQHADDLVQETALQALQRPPQHRGALHSWFVAVLRHFASKHHRRERVRRQPLALPAPAELPPDLLAAQRETIQQLTAAVVALPEPYQRVVLLRFFQDLTPTAIAAQTGEPLATVKSRLQRGLALLRQRLDGDQCNWRSAIAGAFGLERASAVAGGAALGTGVLLMGSGVKLAIGGAAAVIAVAATLFFAGGAPVTEAGTPATRGPVAAVTGAGATDSLAGETARREVVAATIDAAVLASIRGRCVDEAGRPLAGVTTQIRGHKLDGYEVPAESVQASVPPATKSDGLFEIALPPTPGLARISLALELPQRCGAEGTIEISAGMSMELGDVVMLPAIAVSGRVVDSDGQPQAGVRMEMQRDSTAQATPLIGVRRQGSLTTLADGTFQSTEALCAGRWWFHVRNRTLLRAQDRSLILVAEVPNATVELVVRSDRELPPVTGLVVDEAGAAIAGATVSMGGDGAYTDKEGAFTLRLGNDQEQSRLVVEANRDGYIGASVKVDSLGSHVRLVLRRAPGLRVIAKDDSGAPIAAFAVGIYGMQNRRVGWQVATLPRKTWPLGVATLSTLQPGDYAVLVEPEASRWATSGFVMVKVEPETANEVVVTLHPRVRTQVRLRLPDGTPAPGVDVELIDPFSRPIGIDTLSFGLEDWSVLQGPEKALRIDRAQTDAHGEVQLSGRSDSDLALRLRGGAVALQVIQPIRLAAGEPLELTVRQGAVLTGKLTPAATAAELFAASQRGVNEPPERNVYGIALWRDTESMQQFEAPLCLFDREGAFQIDSIPAGTWQVTVYAMRVRYHACEITVREGERLERDLDISCLQLCELELTIYVDGVLATDAWANILATHQPGWHGTPTRSGKATHTDSAGILRCRTFPGEFGVDVQVPRGTDGRTAMVCMPVVTVPAQKHYQRVIDVRLGDARLRVLRPDGSLAPEMELQLQGPTHRPQVLRVLDGAATFNNFPVGKYTARARVHSLTTRDGQGAFAKVNGWQALQDAWIDVGLVEVRAGASGEVVELRLPPEWAR